MFNRNLILLEAGTESFFLSGASPDRKKHTTAIEAKSTARTHDGHLKGLRSIVKDQPRIKRRIAVSRETRARRTSDGIEVMPAEDFVKRLWGGDII